MIWLSAYAVCGVLMGAAVSGELWQRGALLHRIPFIITCGVFWPVCVLIVLYWTVYFLFGGE